MKPKDNILETQLKQGRIAEACNFPKVVLIDTISYCNLQCSMCIHKTMTREKGIMGEKLFRKIIDEIAAVNKNTRVWMVFFGEALILNNSKPSIFDLIRYAKSKCLEDVVLNSNANLLDERSSVDLINSGLDAIYIGLDAFKSDTYSRIRVGGDHKKVVDNIIHLIKIKKTMKASKPEVFVQFVEMEDNKHEKEDFIKFWTGKGVTVKIRPKVSWAGLIDAPDLTLGNDDRWPCHWLMQTMSITNTGDVVTCAVDLDARFVAGNVADQSIGYVWNGTLKRLRTLHTEKKWDRLPPHCRDCRDWQSARADYHSLNP